MIKNIYGVKMKEIYIDVYNQYFYLHFGKDSYIKAYKEEPKYKGEVRSNKEGNIFMWVCDKKDTLTLIHESFHLGEIISKKVGIKFKGEVGAYLLECIVKQVLK